VVQRAHRHSMRLRVLLQRLTTAPRSFHVLKPELLASALRTLRSHASLPRQMSATELGSLQLSREDCACWSAYLQCLHRTREQWMRTRTARINCLRGQCREFGLFVAQGARLGLEQIARLIADPRTPVPQILLATMRSLVDEIRLLEVRIHELEKQLG